MRAIFVPSLSSSHDIGNMEGDAFQKVSISIYEWWNGDGM
jgi:hypothetical protein